MDPNADFQPLLVTRSTQQCYGDFFFILWFKFILGTFCVMQHLGATYLPRLYCFLFNVLIRVYK